MRKFATIALLLALSACAQQNNQNFVVEISKLEISIQDCNNFGNIFKMFDEWDYTDFVPDELSCYKFRLNNPTKVDSIVFSATKRRGFSDNFDIFASVDDNNFVLSQSNQVINLNGATISKLDFLVRNNCTDMQRREFYHDSVPFVLKIQSHVSNNKPVAFSGLKFYHNGRCINDSTILSIGSEAKKQGLSVNTKKLMTNLLDGSLLDRKVQCKNSKCDFMFLLSKDGNFSLVDVNNNWYFGHWNEDELGCRNFVITSASNNANIKTVSVYINGNQMVVPALGVDVNYDGADSDFINLKTFCDLFFFDIRYATDNNFTNSQLYDEPICYLRYVAARDLISAAKDFRNQGFKIKMFDGYRPYKFQVAMWKVCPNPNFLSPPTTGSIHNRGGAVDLTLAYLNGENLDMGTDYDVCSPVAYTTYLNLPDSVLQHRKLLSETLARHNFNTIRTEWWHLTHKIARSFGLCNFVPKEFVEKGN